ncbi:MAG: N-acetylneuraminate synthase family protein [Planctomycetes bacterium]|nr:N-acetylneuraminate synthase family protein [Planctomycetota bacterium]
MVRIIAEVAQGYEGKPDYCRLYVKAAAKAGADAVKFQIVYADDVAEPGYAYYDWYKKLEMDVSLWREVRELAGGLGIDLLADISGERAMKVAESIGLDGIKIHSSNFFNRSLIRRAFDLAPRVFVSLGGIEEGEIAQLVAVATEWGKRGSLALLYGFQAEPTPIERSSLSRIRLLDEKYPDLEIGYMDHAPGDSDDRVHLSLLAGALGADWIEKHLTLSRYLEIEDWVSALEPAEFEVYVSTVRRLEAAYGEPTMALTDPEWAYREKSVKKLLAARDVRAGRAIVPADLVFKRTARIPAGRGFHDPGLVLGRTLSRSLAAGEPILAEDLQ